MLWSVVGQLCKFIVDTSKAGCSALAVNISGPSRVELISREVDEGYEFSYTPLSPGDYLITIKYGGSQVPGSPFNAHIEGTNHSLMFTQHQAKPCPVRK